MGLLGRSLIGGQDATDGGDFFQAWNPATGEKLEPKFAPATKEDVERAAQLADQAFAVFSQVRPVDKAAFLRRIA